MRHILLIRHGLPHEGHPLHPGDPPLHPNGKLHAQRLARRLMKEGVDKIYSSPQRRAIDTAQPLSRLLSLEPTICEGLAEVDYGTDRYRSVETLQAEFPDRYPEFFLSPARFFGKDPNEFRAGVLSAFNEVAQDLSGNCIAVFAHGMTIKTILCAALNTEEAYARLLINHCSVSRLWCSNTGEVGVASVNESLCKPA